MNTPHRRNERAKRVNERGTKEVYKKGVLITQGLYAASDKSASDGKWESAC